MTILDALNSLYRNLNSRISEMEFIPVVAKVSSTVSFSVSAFGTGLTYQWQISTNKGKTWQNSTASGATTASVSTTATTGRNGYLYRCVISYGSKSWTSPPQKLIVLS